MACTISISDSPDDVWMAQNRIFHAFAAEVVGRFSGDDEIVRQVELAEATNGVSLDLLYEEHPELSIRLRQAFQSAANDVAQGGTSLSGGAIDSTQIRSLFFNLVKLLDRFHPEEKEPPIRE